MVTKNEESNRYSKKLKRINKTHLKKLLQQGFTDEQISDFFGITRGTLHRWKRLHPRLNQQIIDWRATADEKVEKALFKRATGYDLVENTKEPNKEGEMRIKKQVNKHVPASEVAMIFWLTNRKHGDWKRTREEVGADPLSIKVYNIIKEKEAKEKRGKSKSKISVDSSVSIQRGGLKVVD